MKEQIVLQNLKKKNGREIFEGQLADLLYIACKGSPNSDFRTFTVDSGHTVVKLAVVYSVCCEKLSWTDIAFNYMFKRYNCFIKMGSGAVGN